MHLLQMQWMTSSSTTFTSEFGKAHLEKLAEFGKAHGLEQSPGKMVWKSHPNGLEKPSEAVAIWFGKATA